MSIKPSLKSAYGKYAIPDVIHRLHQLHRYYTDQGFDMSTIGFRMLDSYTPYSITPPDLIPFADTGGDGIHFGFLTNFGKVPNLENAPIVCVTPTNDPPIRLIARNLVEFLGLSISVPHVEHLESWWSCDRDQEEYKLREEEAYDADLSFEFLRTRNEIFARLRHDFGANPKPVLPYINELLREHETVPNLMTFDGLGVYGVATAHEPYAFDPRRSEDDDELNRMRNYLDTVGNMDAKLAFIRDANYWYVLDRYHPSPLSVLLRELMLSLELRDEVTRMFDIREE